MVSVSSFLSQACGRSTRITQAVFSFLLVFATSAITIASSPPAVALASTPTVTAPSATTFTRNAAGQEPGDFVIANFGAEDTLLVSIGLVHPPIGTSFVLPITTGLTPGYGYNFTGEKTQISFTGRQADANAALAAMTVSTSSDVGDVVFRVSASIRTANVYFNPVNSHYYEYVSTPATTDCKEGADATCVTNIEDAIASKTLFGAQGYWTTITSEQENTFIANNMFAPNIAIGLSDRETEGTWRWLHGPEKGESTFFNWADGEPNDASGCGLGSDPLTCFPGEDYVVTNWDSSVGLWNDYGRPYHDNELSYIVEYSSDCYSLTNDVCVADTFSASSQASATVTNSVGSGFARPAEFPSDMPAPPYAFFNSVSCSSPGNCTAVGSFQVPIEGQESSTSDAITMTSTEGVWAPARTAVFPVDIQSEVHNANFTSISCSSSGNCTAVGSFKSREIGDVTRAFTMTMTNDVWGLARQPELPESVKWPQSESETASHFGADILNSVSCASPGNCTAVGHLINYTTDGGEAFTMTSMNGIWGVARVAEISAQFEPHNATFNSVSCASPGNCTAVGKFLNSSNMQEAFTMSMVDGVWAQGRPAEFRNGVHGSYYLDEFNSVSCTSPGNCTAVGKFVNPFSMLEALTMTMTDGIWGLARPAVFSAMVQNETRGGMSNSVSCTSPGNCTVVGFFVNSDGYSEAFTLSMANGTWDLARPASFDSGVQIPSPNANFTSVSCASPGNCTAVGNFQPVTGGMKAFTMTSTNGVWNNAVPTVFASSTHQNDFPESQLSSVSCASPGNCTMVGSFHDPVGFEAFTATFAYDTPLPPSEGWELARPSEFPNGLFGLSEISVTSVSCATPGNCTVVGSFQDITNSVRAFTMTSTNGVWAPARAAEFSDNVQSPAYSDARFTWVSCATPGNCTAVGRFANVSTGFEAFTMTSTGGVWSLARPAVFPTGIQNDSPNGQFNSVSCTSSGNCTAVGSYVNTASQSAAFAMESIDGVWGLARPAVFPTGVQSNNPPTSFASVSCASVGNCTAAGDYLLSQGSAGAMFTMSSKKATPVPPTTTTTATVPITTTTTVTSPTSTVVPITTTSTVAPITSTTIASSSTATTSAPLRLSQIKVSTKPLDRLPATGNTLGLANLAMCMLILGVLVLLTRKRRYN